MTTSASTEWREMNKETSIKRDFLKLQDVIRPKVSICGYHIDSAVFSKRDSEDPSTKDPIDSVHVIWTRLNANHDSPKSGNLREKHEAAGLKCSKNARVMHTKMKEKAVMSPEFSHFESRRENKMEHRFRHVPRDSSSTEVKSKMAMSNVLHHSHLNAQRSPAPKIGEEHNLMKNKDKRQQNGIKKKIKNKTIKEEKSINDSQQRDTRSRYRTVNETNFIFEDTTPVDEYMIFMYGSETRRNPHGNIKSFKIREKTKKYWTRFSKKCHKMISSITMFQRVCRNRRENSEDNVTVGDTQTPTDIPELHSLQRCTLDGKIRKYDCFV